MTNVGKIFANTLASYNSKFLLDEERIRRLIAVGYQEAIKMLQNHGWGEGMYTADADTLIDGEIARLVAFVREYSPSEKTREVCLIDFLFTSVKSHYKAKLSGIVAPKAVYEGFEYLLPLIKRGDYSELPSVLADCLEELDALPQPLSARELEMAIIRAKYAYLLSLARGSHSLVEYIKSDIDLKNLLTLFRCRLLELSEQAMQSMLIEGGTLDPYDLEIALKADADRFEQFISRTKYDEIFANVSAGGDGIADIETAIDNYLFSLTLSHSASYLSDTPFINYFFRKILELKTIRTVLICLKNNAVDEIKRRLRIYE